MWLFYFYAHCNVSDLFPLHLIVTVIDDDLKYNFRINMHFKKDPTQQESTCWTPNNNLRPSNKQTILYTVYLI